jgi:hypothetical protein
VNSAVDSNLDLMYIDDLMEFSLLMDMNVLGDNIVPAVPHEEKKKKKTKKRFDCISITSKLSNK